MAKVRRWGLNRRKSKKVEKEYYLRKSSLRQAREVKRVDDDQVDLDLLLAKPVDPLAGEPPRVRLVNVPDPERLLRRPVPGHLVIHLDR